MDARLEDQQRKTQDHVGKTHYVVEELEGVDGERRGVKCKVEEVEGGIDPVESEPPPPAAAAGAAPAAEAPVLEAAL